MFSPRMHNLLRAIRRPLSELWYVENTRETFWICYRREDAFYAVADVFSKKWKDEKVRGMAWRSGATKSRQKWAPLEKPRAYRTLSTKRRTCRYLPSNEDQTPDRAHFVVPGGTSRTWGEVPGSEGYARALATLAVYLKILLRGERAASTKTYQFFFYRPLLNLARCAHTLWEAMPILHTTCCTKLRNYSKIGAAMPLMFTTKTLN